jgi:hypothetical protein
MIMIAQVLFWSSIAFIFYAYAGFLAISVWWKLPVPVTNAISPHIVKTLP